MATPEFTKIASYANPAEADQMRGILEENGIRAFVDGASLNTALSHIGSALGGVGLIVLTRQAERAVQLMDEVQRVSKQDHGEAWYCGECEEEVDEGFDVCWNCGKPRREVEAPFPESAELATEPGDPDPRDPANENLPKNASLDESNPYASPWTQSIQESETFQLPGDGEAEAILVRAWNMSILGLFVPAFAPGYSMYLLYDALTSNQVNSEQDKSLFAWTIGLNLFSGLLWSLALLLIRLPFGS